MRILLRNGALGLGLLVACGPMMPGGAETLSTGEAPGSSGPESAGLTEASSDDTPTSAPPAAETSSADPSSSAGESSSTGPGDGCDGAAPSLTPVWTLEPDLAVQGTTVSLSASLALASDGRLAVGATVTAEQGLEVAPAVLWVAPEGAVLGLEIGAKRELWSLETRALQLDGDDTAVLVGDQLDVDQHGVWIARFAAGGPELGHVVSPLAHLQQPVDLVLTDAAVIVGYERETLAPFVASVDPDSGAVHWEQALPAAATIAGRFIVAGPSGDVLVAYGTQEQLSVFRLDAATGMATWGVHVPALPSGAAGGLLLTADGQVVALQMGMGQAPRVGLISVAVDDGALLWELEVAVPDDAGDPRAGGIVDDAAGLAVLIGRGPNLSTTGTADPLSAALHRVSSTGSLVEVAPLTLGGLTKGDPLLRPLRGACGQLFVLHGLANIPWLGAFAP